MNRTDVCILLNSTPKYYPIVHLQLKLFRRYAPDLHWTFFFATEIPEDPSVQELVREYGVKLLVLDPLDTGFLESREAALRKLPSQYTYVLSIQDDFLLDRAPMYDKLAEACTLLDMDRNIASLRLCPCPGPSKEDPLYHKDKQWRILSDKDSMIFTYQATLWRTYDLQKFYAALLMKVGTDFPNHTTPQQKKEIALKLNCAETEFGQRILRAQPTVLHLAWDRVGPWANAVYLCPFPYRPTAIVQGKLEEFAVELARREGLSFDLKKALA
jgi:hypothetical protein